MNRRGSANLVAEFGIHAANVPPSDHSQAALTRAENSLAKINDQLASTETQERSSLLQAAQTAERNRALAIRTHRPFGHAVATSGFRSRPSGGANWEMDWALIEATNGRSVSNLV